MGYPGLQIVKNGINLGSIYGEPALALARDGAGVSASGHSLADRGLLGRPEQPSTHPYQLPQESPGLARIREESKTPPQTPPRESPRLTRIREAWRRFSPNFRTFDAPQE